MRIGIVSDTHLPRGSRRIPAACLDRLAASNLIVHTGDFSSVAAFEEMLALGPPVEAVYGNVDDDELRERLPAEHEFTVDGVHLALVHNAGPAGGRLARMRRRFPDADAVIFGHSHVPLHEVGGNLQIFNPGSPTERRRAPRHTMGEATATAGRIRFEHVALD